MATHIRAGRVKYEHEAIAQDHLARLLADEWLVISNPPRDLTGTEIDCLVAGREGLLCVELKDWPDGTVAASEGSDWTLNGEVQRYKGGKVKQNPVEQAMEAARNLHDLLFHEMQFKGRIDACALAGPYGVELRYANPAVKNVARPLQEAAALVTARIERGRIGKKHGCQPLRTAEAQGLLRIFGLGDDERAQAWFDRVYAEPARRAKQAQLARAEEDRREQEATASRSVVSAQISRPANIVPAFSSNVVRLDPRHRHAPDPVWKRLSPGFLKITVVVIILLLSLNTASCILRDLKSFFSPGQTANASANAHSTLTFQPFSSPVTYEISGVSQLNLRAGPGTSYNAVTQLLNGERVSGTGSVVNGDLRWIYVTTSNGSTGYLSERYLRVPPTASTSNVPDPDTVSQNASDTNDPQENTRSASGDISTDEASRREAIVRPPARGPVVRAPTVACILPGKGEAQLSRSDCRSQGGSIYE